MSTTCFVSEHEQLSPRANPGWSEGWSRLLESVDSLLHSPLGVEQTLRVVTRLPVPSLADFSELYLANADGALRRVEHAHCDPEEERQAVRLQAWFQDHVPAPVMRVAISNLPLFAPRVDDTLLGQLASAPRHLDRLQDHRPRSLLVVPIRCRSVVAALALGHSVSGRNHEARDLQPAQELARRAGMALDSAFRHQASAEEARAQHQLLRVLSHTLQGPLTQLSDASRAGEVAAASGSLEEATLALSRLRDLTSRFSRLVEELFEPERARRPGLLQPAPQGLGPLLRRAWERSRYPVGPLELSLPPDMPPVEVDGDRMVELLRDLMEDAALEGAPDRPLHVGVEPCATGLRISIHAQALQHGPEVEPGWWYVTQQVVQTHQGCLERLALAGRRGYALTLPAPVSLPRS